MNRKRKILLVSTLLSLMIVCIIAVLSIKHDQNKSKLESLINGNYDYLSDDNVKDELQRILDREETEWVYFDLNADGKMELILQEKDYVTDMHLKRIIGAFAVQDNGISTVIWDLNDMTAFYFIGNDRIIYLYQYHGMYDYERYQIYQYDSDCNEKLLEGFEYFYIYDMEELPPDWLEYYPTMTQEGTYYRKFDRIEDSNGTLDWIYEDLSEQQWKEGLNIF